MPRSPAAVLLLGLALVRWSGVAGAARALELAPAGLRSMLRRYGVHPRRRPHARRARTVRRRHELADVGTAWELYQTRTIRETAHLVGVSPPCLRRAFRRAGLPTRDSEATWAMKRRTRGPTLGRVGQEGVAWAWAYYQRHSLVETAAYCEVSPRYLRTLFREAGHPVRSPIETMRLLARGPFTRAAA